MLQRYLLWLEGRSCGPEYITLTLLFIFVLMSCSAEHFSSVQHMLRLWQYWTELHDILE